MRSNTPQKNQIKLPKRISETLKQIIPILDKNKINYQISGGTAARFYNSKRKISDIDIDVSKNDFNKIIILFETSIVSGPELYVDKKWKTLMITLNLNSQIVEFTNADYMEISNPNRDTWIPFIFDLQDAKTFYVENMPVKVINPEKLIEYKKLLDWKKQKIDILAIKHYLSKI